MNRILQEVVEENFVKVKQDLKLSAPKIEIFWIELFLVLCRKNRNDRAEFQLLYSVTHKRIVGDDRLKNFNDF